MEKTEIFNHILNSWNKPIVFVDTNHTIIYMNAPAKIHYAKWGDVIGKSIFDCHNEKSTQIIKDTLAKLENGQEEALIVDNEKHRIYMRGVRDANANLIGYYERYDPPLGK
jgi:DUF438 domain-containing protein